MKTISYIFPVFSLLLLSAHFSRNNMTILSILFLLLPLLFLIKKFWVKRVLELVLFIGSIVWIFAIFHYVKIRIANNQDWLRLVIILGAVALFTLFSALLFEFGYLKARYKK
jgi:hypothetical protein